MSKKYLIETFGCQMNVHDSERMAGLLDQAGYEPAADQVGDRSGGRTGPAAGFEDAGDPLGVVDVHLAAVGAHLIRTRLLRHVVQRTGCSTPADPRDRPGPEISGRRP